MSVLHLPVTADVLLLYPGESLKDQIGLWAVRHPERRVEMSCGWSLPEVRALLHYAGAVLVDATENPASCATDFCARLCGWGPPPFSCTPRKCTTPWSCWFACTARCSARTVVRRAVGGVLPEAAGDEVHGHRLADAAAAAPAYRLRRTAQSGSRNRPPANRFRSSFNWPVTEIH